MQKLILIISFFFTCGISFCDEIPENSHEVKKCVKITNIEDYPNLSLIALYWHPAIELVNAREIDSKSCIGQSKLVSITIVAVKKEYLTKKGLKSIDWLNDKNVYKSNINPIGYGGYAINENPIVSIDEFYLVVGFRDSTVILSKQKEFLKFNNGQPSLLIKYRYGRPVIESVEYIENKKAKVVTSVVFSASYLLNFLKSLLFTIIIETLVLFVVMKGGFRKIQLGVGILLFTGIICSFATLPYVWYILPLLIKNHAAYIAISEVSVFLIESMIIWRLLKVDLKVAILLSLICNLTSFLLGLILI